MKKFVSLVLSLSLAVTLAACGSGDAPADPPSEAPGDEVTVETDSQYIKDKGKLVVGITNFAPMDYQEAGSSEWIGFDADMAKLFAESLGVDVEFTEITWGYKVMELDSKNIDCVWNGMTLTDEVKAAMATSMPYCLNAQVLVVAADKADNYKDLKDLSGLTVAVEDGSAGEDAAVALGASITEVIAQSDALMEVAAGYADAAVIDLLMAGAMIGEGTGYDGLTYTVNLNELQGLESEKYGVGFRKDSDLKALFDQFWTDKVADGTVLEMATTYGVQESVILN